MHAVTETPREAMVQRHLLWVWRYLRAHGARADEADDLAQEAFVVALQKGAADLDPAATAAFLRRTARFLLLRHRRAAHANSDLADAVDALWDRECADGGDELLAALRRCVDLLPEHARRAVELGYGLGAGLGASAEASRAHIAATLAMTENGVKTLLQRTRQRLRACVTRRLHRQETTT